MKLNKNIKYICASGFLLLAASCGDSYLDKEPTSYISTDQLKLEALWNSQIMLGQALGTYSTTFEFGTGGTTGHDDFGQKSIDIATDILSGDMAMGGKTYGWFAPDSDLNSNTATRDRTYMIWRYYYRLIKACNEITDAVGGDENVPELKENAGYFAKALALRAHSYFNLVNLYARPYDVAKNTPALPIYRSQLTAETAGLSTVEDVYNLVIRDLNLAIKVLSDFQVATGSADSQINVWSAKGILAYVYLTMGDNEKAAELSADVIKNSPYSMLKYSDLYSGFNTIANNNWLWGVDITKDNSAGLPTFWGHVDYFTYSYCSAGDYKKIDQNLYSSMPATDARKRWFHPSVLISWYKFFDNGRVGMGDRAWTNDILFMRADEMWLINIEANARLNNLDAAKESMVDFMNQRLYEGYFVPQITEGMTEEEIEQAKQAAEQAKQDAYKKQAEDIKAYSQEELLDFIYYNWRVEMWAEGRGLMTMKRFKKTIVRGANNISYPGESISYDDPRLYFEIPERETTNNPNLKQ